ncbi:hypothetical protein [Deinococcus ruber]|uniref:Uncharacterized protein n=1 Tax=Deinococcus ruber TaxID=1848197 RepID=A0A918F6J9_9DEIO|nr:hypothetical protein [Deinococcus ruber]GGR12743.1 hypothetical protein GCM10008957_27090 [Deinococcus ruber]
MSELEDFVASRIKVLDELEQDATPTERTFYHSTRQELLSYLESPAALSNAPLKDRIDAAHLKIQRLTYEIDREEYGEPWRAWAHSERQLIEARVEKLKAQLSESEKISYSPPTLSQKQIEYDNTLNATQIRVEELETLIGMLEVWGERKSSEDEANHHIDGLKQQLQRAKLNLSTLIDNPF